jgi:three-Cys-motif partner protein
MEHLVNLEETAMVKKPFGGRTWTEEKLERVGKYLPAFTTALKRQGFKLVYIDAFAGDGWVEYKKLAGSQRYLDLDLPQLAGFSEGSAIRAVKTTPMFDGYYFIDDDPAKVERLKASVATANPRALARSSFQVADANAALQEVTNAIDWRETRAVAFLDPYGAEVDWRTLDLIAAHRGIDLWYLFPAMAVQRMLPRHGAVPDAWGHRLDRLLGATDWRERFLKDRPSADLFDSTMERKESTANMRAIEDYVTGRLRSTFKGGTGSRAVPLMNSKGSTMFLLFFAMTNPDPKAITRAMKIANHILR